jgi:hypothetical protein
LWLSEAHVVAGSQKDKKSKTTIPGFTDNPIFHRFLATARVFLCALFWHPRIMLRLSRVAFDNIVLRQVIGQ